MEQPSPLATKEQTPQRPLYHIHRPAECLQQSVGAASANDLALVILNQPINNRTIKTARDIRRLKDKALICLCVDGGANRLYEFLADDQMAQASCLPDGIHGDLDSLHDSVKSFYSKRDVSITRDSDQYTDDFEKVCKLIRQSHSTVTNLLILGSISGRLDHGLGLLSGMLREQTMSEKPLKPWLLSEQSISFILDPGANSLECGSEPRIFAPNIGLLPIYGPACITTRGLEWDVENWHTRMGGPVSTSNHIMSDVVDIITDVRILCTIELREL